MPDGNFAIQINAKLKKVQWISVCVALILVVVIYSFGRTVPTKKNLAATEHNADDGHDHGAPPAELSTDTVLSMAKKQLTPEQLNRVTQIENAVTRGDVKNQQLAVFRQLAGFWGDSMHFFPPYAWYQAESARLENSEKSLTFAARLLLDNLQEEENPALRKWEALQSKDLFERSLKLNPANDSAKVGLGALMLYGGISDAPMAAIAMIREVTERDSTNVYAQMTLAKGSVFSGQLDRAITRLELVHRLDHENVEAMLMLAEVYERKKDNKTAADWYERSINHIDREDIKTEIRKRVAELKK